jgi:hypothetical protein
MSRLSKVLKDSTHPIVAVVRLQLDDLRSLLKKAKHGAMVNISKRIIPDDMKVHVADFSGVVPSYFPEKLTKCETKLDPTEREFGAVDPRTMAANVVELAGACREASNALRLMVEGVLATREASEGALACYDARLLRGQIIDDYEVVVARDIINHASDLLSATHLRSMLKRLRGQNVFRGMRTTVAPVVRARDMAGKARAVLDSLQVLRSAAAVAVCTNAEAYERYPEIVGTKRGEAADPEPAIRESITRNLDFDPMSPHTCRYFLVTATDGGITLLESKSL